MTAIAPVINIRKNEVQKVYESFLKEHRRNSERTANEYHSRVNEFFQLILKKDVRFITLEDIKSIKNMDVQSKFVDTLLEKGNSKSTIVTKLNSVRSFYNDLLRNDMQVNPMVLKVKLKVNPKHHESLSQSELFNLFEFMKNEKEGLEKYLLTKTLFHTAGRKSSTLGLRWSDIKQKRDIDNGQSVWVIEVIGKGQKILETPVSDEFYNELLQLKSDKELIFSNLGTGGGYKRYERSLKKFGMSIGKNISIHSLKATSITLAYQMTKDLNLCKQLGGHSSISTTEIYIRDEKSYTKQISYSMGKAIDTSTYDNMTGDELKRFIDDNYDLKMAIVTRLATK